MAELLKDRYNRNFYKIFASVVSEVIPTFDRDKFLEDIFSSIWTDMELKQRMWHTADCLHDQLSKDFESASMSILNIVELLKARNMYDLGLEFMFIPHYYEKFGIGEFKISLDAFEKITSLTSCEFAVRPFIIRYPKKTLARMLGWSNHDDEHVRRLATEGSRPRLPWSIALPDFKRDPGPILPILWNLKSDPSEYVRRSVANNLNDIAKDNARVTIDICKQWKGASKETDALVKHGARTLLKAGNKEILKVFGYDPNDVLLIDFEVQTNKVQLGRELTFTARITNESNREKVIRLEYAIYFMRKRGEYGKKVFKISEKIYQPNVEAKIAKSHSFRSISTRMYYPGNHFVTIIYSGLETDKRAFQVIK